MDNSREKTFSESTCLSVWEAVQILEVGNTEDDWIWWALKENGGCWRLAVGGNSMLYIGNFPLDIFKYQEKLMCEIQSTFMNVVIGGDPPWETVERKRKRVIWY